MTGLLILTFIPAVAAVLFWLRIREQRRIIEELRAERVRARSAGDDDAHSQLFGTVAHELRSPIAAILGYEELLAEGVFGTLEPRAEEALARIRSSARQLLTLTEGMQELSGRASASPEFEDVDYGRALQEACARAGAEASARRVRIETPAGIDTGITGRSEAHSLEAILDAVLGAALKTSADRAIEPAVLLEGDTVLFRFGSTGVDAEGIEVEPLASGAGLRFAIARQMAERLGGSVQATPEDDGTTLMIRLPRVPPGAAGPPGSRGGPG